MHKSRLHWVVAALLIGGLLFPRAAAAQFKTGDKYLGAHVGMSGVGSTAALGVSGEVAYTDRIAIGGWADYWSYGDDYIVLGTNYGWDVRYIALAGTGSYHFPIDSQPKLDPFLGLALGYFIVSADSRAAGSVSYSGNASRIFLGGFGGARYHFTPSVAGVARAGFGASYLTVGVDLKL